MRTASTAALRRTVPHPPLPRKRGREQIELVALTDVIGMSVEERMTRRMLLAALTSVALLSAAAPGMAQTGDDFPNRPIRIIVPQAAGSGVDLQARVLAQKMGELWGQQGV